MPGMWNLITQIKLILFFHWIIVGVQVPKRACVGFLFQKLMFLMFDACWYCAADHGLPTKKNGWACNHSCNIWDIKDAKRAKSRVWNSEISFQGMRRKWICKFTCNSGSIHKDIPKAKTAVQNPEFRWGETAESGSYTHRVRTDEIPESRIQNPQIDSSKFSRWSQATLRGGSTGILRWADAACIWLCLNFALSILRPTLRLCLSLPMLVPQGYSSLFVSILSGESKELITMMKARVQRWKSLRYDLHYIIGLYRHVIISSMTFWPCRTSSGLTWGIPG